jgi:UDP-2-acetamido-2,6-beta-L-arabino-hexul-4-ose reductase
MPVEIEKIEVYSDYRGIVFEPLEAEKLADQGNVHVVVSRPGAVRGNHVHRRGTETVTVVGPALVRYREDGAERDVDIPAGEAFRFVFPPGVAHAIRNTGDQPGLLVAFGSLAHDPQHPDTAAEVLIRPDEAA